MLLQEYVLVTPQAAAAKPVREDEAMASGGAGIK